MPCRFVFCTFFTGHRRTAENGYQYYFGKGYIYDSYLCFPCSGATLRLHKFEFGAESWVAALFIIRSTTGAVERAVSFSCHFAMSASEGRSFSVWVVPQELG